jgi:hydroxymethylpyrimidine/phosphomethylpyrimidine kinase
MSAPIAVTIAGSDSGGGAGIQADLKTFAALGVFGASVVTALTAQNTTGIFAVHAVPPDFVGAQIDAVFSDMAVRAVKIGMLANAGVIDAVMVGLARHHARNVVLDPVMASSSGETLLRPDAIAKLRQLMTGVRVVTPNLPEAAALLGVEIARDESSMREQAKQLRGQGAAAVLIKGGHGTGPESVDYLLDDDRCERFAAPRVATANTHGTGCTFAAAIAAGLAKGHNLKDAVLEAKAYVTAAIAAADRLAIGSGPGPLHHFHAWW